MNYLAVKDGFEAHYAILPHQGVYVYEHDDHVEIVTENRLRAGWKHLTFDVKGKPKPFFKKWVEDPDKRSYLGFGWFPTECPDNTLNLWGKTISRDARTRSILQ